MIGVTLRQLEYVVAIADHGGFGAAASVCAVSQPALSAQVAIVEDTLGVVLFERSRPVRPTRDGARVIDAARAVLRSARDLHALARGLADPLAGTVVIGVIPTFAPYLIGRLHPRFQAELPRLDVRWREAKTADLELAVADGTVDVAWIADKPSRDDLDHRVIGHEPFLAVLPGRGDPTPVALADLHAPVLLLEDGHCLRDQTTALCQAHTLPTSAFTATSLATLVQLVAAGFGVTFLPACAVAHEVGPGVHARPLTEPVGRAAVLAWRRTDPRERLFDALARVAGAMLG